MIEYKKFIYLDVYKTGSTHINNLLKQITLEPEIRRNRHAPLTKVRPFTWKGGKLVFATVRNPWDWYVSMWAYGHTKENPLYSHIKDALGKKQLEKLYDTENPKTSFPLWLSSIHDPAFLAKVLAGHRLPVSGLADFMGFYTYRFMRVTLPYPELLLRGPFIRSLDSAIAMQKRFATYEVMMKSETLDEEFADFVVKYRERCGFTQQAVDLVRANAESHKNASVRTLASYRDYYTDELRDLVAKRDRMFIDLFDYSF
jgi:hypothetical protein